MINKFEEENFWELYPVYKLKKPFTQIYKVHKKKKNVSDMAWFVWLFSDTNSPFFTYPEDVRIQELDANFPGVKDIKEVQDAINEYEEHMCTADERAFRQWTKKLQDRATYLESLRYQDFELDEAKNLDAMLVASQKIWDAFAKVKETYEKAKAENVIMGGGSETFLEQS